MTTQGITSSVEERALKLLGSGIGPEQTATALGVSVSRISQLLSTPEFMEQVAEIRFNVLSKHNARDDEYDTLEDDLIKQFKIVAPMMLRPLEIISALAKINAMKRRGQAAPEQISNQSTVVNLTIPVQVIQKFTTNILNQVIQTGEQKLVTIQSGTLMDKIKAIAGEAMEKGQNESARQLTNRETVVSSQ